MSMSLNGLRLERMKAAANYKDGFFFNNDPRLELPKAKRSMLSITGEFVFGNKKNRLPPGVIPVESPLEDWKRSIETGLRATWLGHSTVLLEIDGVRVLTDPVMWSERISPVPFAGPKRFHAPPVEIAQLPALDAVLISHDHYDHLDVPSVRELARTGVPFITSLGVGARLESLGIESSRITELDWWETTRVANASGDAGRRPRGVEVRAAPSRHFSGRTPFDRNRTFWSSWVLRSERHNVYFSGDTGPTRDFETIRERAIDGGEFDLVMLEIGAWNEAWGDIHLGPEHALEAFRMLGGKTLLPVHWGTFDLGLHPWAEPAETLAALAKDAHVITPRLGRVVEPSRVERIDAWWREVSSPASPELDIVRTGLASCRTP